MQSSLLTNLLLPLALGVIMLGLGLGLTLADFRRVARYPRAVLTGLFLQTAVLPWVALGLALLFKLPPELAVGLMLLAASPGGATANIYSHLARGDVAALFVEVIQGEAGVGCPVVKALQQLRAAHHEQGPQWRGRRGAGGHRDRDR